MKSIIQLNEDRCFICGSWRDLETHHCWHGTSNRRLADEDGLTVKLCAKCHRDLHDKGLEDKWLMRRAQEAWISFYGKTTEEFRRRYGKTV